MKQDETDKLITAIVKRLENTNGDTRKKIMETCSDKREQVMTLDAYPKLLAP